MILQRTLLGAMALLSSFAFSQIETSSTFNNPPIRLSTIKSSEGFTLDLLRNNDFTPRAFGRVLGENPSATSLALDLNKQQFVASGLIAQNRSTGFMVAGNAGVANENQFKNLFLGAGINPKVMGGIQFHFANKTKVEVKNTLSNSAYAAMEQERERFVEQQLKNTTAEIEALQRAVKTSITSEELAELLLKKQAQLDTLNFHFMMKQQSNEVLRYTFFYNTFGAGVETARYDFLPSEIGTDTSIYSKRYKGWEMFYQFNVVFHNPIKQHTFLHGMRFSFSQKNNVSDLNSSFIRQENALSGTEKKEVHYTAFNAENYANIHYLRLSYDLTYMPLKKDAYNVGVLVGVDALFHPSNIDNQLKFNGGFVFPFTLGNTSNPMILSAIFSSIFRPKTSFLESTFDEKTFFFGYNLRLTKALSWKKN